MIQNPFDFTSANAANNPRGLAIMGPNTSLTNEEFLESALTLAWLLHTSGVQAGDGVLIALSPEVEAAAIQAVFHRGGFSGHLSSASEDLDFRSMGFSWALVREDAEPVPGLHNLVLTVAALASLPAIPDDFAPRELQSADQLARVIFSSGTTGNPKAVPFTFAQLTARSEFLFEEVMQPGPFLCALGFDVSFGLMTFYASQRYGLCYLQYSTAQNTVDLLVSHSVQTFATSPIGLEKILGFLGSSNFQAPKLQRILTTGGFLSRPVIEKAEQLTGAEVTSLYGSTEVGFVARRIGSGNDVEDAGELFPHAQVEIVDEVGNPLPEGATGIVRVKTPWKGAGYLGNSSASEEIFKDGYFYPGDLGMLRNRRLSILGRANLVINVGGVKIDPVPVERFCLESFPELEEAVGFQHITKSGASEFVMAIIAKPEFNQDLALKLLKTKFLAKSPSRFFLVHEIPRNTLGKPLRLLLAKEYLSRPTP